MTKPKAREILGISKSARIKTAKLAYHQQQQKLRLRMVPGNPCSYRQQAQLELAELTEAWKTLGTSKPRARRKPTTNKPVPVNQPSQDLANAWDLLFSLLPFPKPFVISIMILVFLIVFVSLLTNL